MNQRHIGAGRAKPEAVRVPVVANTVAIGDVPIYLRGVGTVIAYNNVGGLALSQLLTLYTTPVVYLDRVQTWLSGRRKQFVRQVESPSAVALE